MLDGIALDLGLGGARRLQVLRLVGQNHEGVRDLEVLVLSDVGRIRRTYRRSPAQTPGSRSMRFLALSAMPLSDIS